MDAIEPTPLDIITRIDSLDVWPSLDAPSFIHRKLHGVPIPSCGMCQKNSLDVPGIRFYVCPIVHPAIGGSQSADNWFLLCTQCHRLRASADPLAASSLLFDCPPLSSSLLEQRHRVLLESRNHLTRHSPQSNVCLISAELAKRHQHPRFRVYGLQGDSVSYVGFTVRYGDWMSKAQAIAMVRHQSQSVEIDHPRMHEIRLFEIATSEFRRIVWELIAMNAWVVPVLDRPSSSSEVDDYWFVSMASPQQLRARNDPVSGKVLPHLPKRKSMKPSAISERKRYRGVQLAKVESDISRVDLQLIDLDMAVALNEIPADAAIVRQTLHLRNDLAVKQSRLVLAKYSDSL